MLYPSCDLDNWLIRSCDLSCSRSLSSFEGLKVLGRYKDDVDDDDKTGASIHKIVTKMKSTNEAIVFDVENLLEG